MKWKNVIQTKQNKTRKNYSFLLEFPPSKLKFYRFYIVFEKKEEEKLNHINIWRQLVKRTMIFFRKKFKNINKVIVS